MGKEYSFERMSFYEERSAMRELWRFAAKANSIMAADAIITSIHASISERVLATAIYPLDSWENRKFDVFCRYVERVHSMGNQTSLTFNIYENRVCRKKVR